MSKKKAKKVTKKKISKKKVKKADISKRVSLHDVESELEKFGLSILAEDSPEEDIAPYKIPFKHWGLQKITGGVIGGKFIEISGASQSGKSFLMYEAMAQAINLGGYALCFDGERALEESYAKMVGLNMRGGRFALGEKQNAAQKKSGIRGEAIIDMDEVFKTIMGFIKAVRSKVKDTSIPVVIGVDSFPALQCKADLENMEKGKDPRGYMAMQKNAKFSQWIEKLIPVLDREGVTFILLNQVRKDNAVMYGDPWRSLCEDVIKFWATQRIRGKLYKKLVKKGKSIEKASGVTIQVGMTTEWCTIKNRAVRPFQKVLTKIYYSKGIDPVSGMDELLVNEGLIKPATTTSVEEALLTLDESKLSEYKITKDGTKFVKPLQGFKMAEGDDKQFYASIESICAAHPDLRQPSWTEIDEDIVEDMEEDVPEGTE